MRRPSTRRVLRARRTLRAGLVQLLGATTGVILGLIVPIIHLGPTIESGRMAELLFTLGVGTLGIATVVFSLLFGVVQWTASTFSPRLTLFRRDPLVWRTFGFSIGVFTFAVTAGLSTGVDGRVSLVLPASVVLAVLIAALLIRELQNRAYQSMQLSYVISALVSSGHAAIQDAYPSAAAPTIPQETELPAQPTSVRTVVWRGEHTVVQQLDLRRLVAAATQADALVVFRVRVGCTLHRGSVLADVHRGDLRDEVVQRAVIPDIERSFVQDPLLAFRLLADIALRALSPAVNDPATAVDAIDAIDDLFRVLAGRDLQAPDIVDSLGACRVRNLLPTWEHFLRTGVEELLPVASNSPMVLERILLMLTELRDAAPPYRHATLIELSERTTTSLRACVPPAVIRSSKR